MSTTRHTRRLARKTLARLKLLAMAEADRLEAAGETDDVEYTTALGAAVMPHATIDRLDSVDIWSPEPGRYHVDFRFRDMPRYLPNVIGTPKEAPLVGKQEAEAWAVTVIAQLILAGRRGGERDAPRDDRVPFELYGQSLHVPRAIVEVVEQRPRRPLMKSAVMIEGIRNRMNGRVSMEGITALSLDDQRFLLAAVSELLIAGLPRYPVRWPLPG